MFYDHNESPRATQAPGQKPKRRTLSPQERRSILTRMVCMEIESETLGPTARSRLIRFGRDLGIGAGEAVLLVDDARRNFAPATRVASGTPLSTDLRVWLREHSRLLFAWGLVSVAWSALLICVRGLLL